LDGLSKAYLFSFIVGSLTWFISPTLKVLVHVKDGSTKVFRENPTQQPKNPKLIGNQRLNHKHIKKNEFRIALK
jgi:hypothetical protein